MHVRVRSSASRALLAALCALCAGACSDSGHSFIARSVRIDLVAEGLAAALVTSGAGEPRLAVVQPSKRLAVEKESLPSLVVPPGASIQLIIDELEPERGELWLSGFIGAGEQAWARLAEHPGDRLTLTVAANGTPIAVADLRGEDVPAWIRLADCALEEGSLRLAPDALLTLSAEATGRLADQDLEAGFARLVVEERREVRSQPATPEHPNLVLFVMDTLRADKTSAHGYSKPTTPRLEALADRGSRFDAAYSTAPWTWPSTASLLTGRTPWSHGLLDFHSSYLASSLDTLPEAALQADLRTGAFIGNPLIVAQRNFDQGFHHFRSTRAAELLDTDVLVPEAIEWLDEAQHGRFFLYVQAMDPHEPHDFLPATQQLFPGAKPRGYPAEGLVGVRTNLLRKRPVFLPDGESRLAATMRSDFLEYAQTTYDRAIRTGDKRFGQLLDDLDRRGLTGNTVIAFTSDHGEEFLEHGGLLHGHNLYEESIHVPLVLAGPGVPAGERFPHPVSNRLLPATLARLAGFPFDPGEPQPDLFDAALDPTNLVRFSNSNGTWDNTSDARQSGLRRGAWKVVSGRRNGEPSSPEEEANFNEELRRAFDLESDQRESDDRSDQAPTELFEELRVADAEDLLRRPIDLHGSGEDTRAMLIQLGYLDEE